MIHIKIYFSVKESAQKTVFVFEFGERQIERAMPERERESERDGHKERRLEQGSLNRLRKGACHQPP